MNCIIGEIWFKLHEKGFKISNATKLRKTSYVISSLDLILAYFNFLARMRKLKKMEMRNFQNTRVTGVTLAFLPRTREAELKHKTKPESDI